MGDSARIVEQSARDHQVFWPIVTATPHARPKTGLPQADPEVEALVGIDETQRGTAKWRWGDGAAA